MTYGIFAMAGMIAVIAAKFLTTARMQASRHLLAEAEAELRRIKSELKVTENDRAIAGRELKQGEKKQNALKRQIDKYDKDLANLKK